MNKYFMGSLCKKLQVEYLVLSSKYQVAGLNLSIV
jgi:hypothetical protein